METHLLTLLEITGRQDNGIIMGTFNNPSTYWVDETASSTKAHHFLNVKMVKSPTRYNALLGLLITNNTELIGDMEVWDNLGSSDHRLIMHAINYQED